MSILALIAACSSENSDLIGAIYEAHLNGEDFLSSEEVRVLKETPAFQTESQYAEIDAFAKFLADDDLSDAEKATLLDQFGGATEVEKQRYTEQLNKFDWHHAWRRSVLTRWQGIDVPFYGVTSPDDSAGEQIFKILQERVDLSTLSWEEKLAMAETVEGYVIAQYRHKPASALEAIRAYSLFEPERKSVPRAFIEILQSDNGTPGRAELVTAIQDWAKVTQNPIIQEELLNIWYEIRLNGQNPSEDFLKVMALVSPPEGLGGVLEKATLDDAEILAGVWVNTTQAAQYSLAWHESGVAITVPWSLRVVFDSEVREQKVAEKRARILDQMDEIEKTQDGKAVATPTLSELQSEITNAGDIEFSLWLSAINSILSEDRKSFSVRDLAFLKTRILTASDAAIVAEFKILFTLKPDLIGTSDFLLLGMILSPEDIAGHQYEREIIAALKADTSPKSFEAFAKCALAGLPQAGWDEVYAKAVRSKTYTSKSLLKDLVAAKPKSEPYWEKIANENTSASARIIQSLRRAEEQKAFAGILSSSSRAKYYRAHAKTWRLSHEMKNLFLDPLVELRGKVPAALLDQMVLIKRPQHRGDITRDFYTSKFEVTNALWKEVMGTDPSAQYGTGFAGADQPVVGVSLVEAQPFFSKLNEKLGPGAKFKFRLPTDAEWEYAARAGTTTERYWGDDADKACDYANVGDESRGCSDGYKNTAPVGKFKPNAYGLHDMIGNVWEWVDDGYTDMSGALRGGSWGGGPDYARAVSRVSTGSNSYSDSFGFRCVLAPQDS